MRLYLATLFTLLASAGYTQDLNSSFKVYDYSNVDVTNVQTRDIAQQLDSIFLTSGYDSLFQLMAFVQQQTYTEKYFSFNIGYQSARGSLSELNGGLRTLGFDKLSEYFGGVPWGFDIRGKRLLATYHMVPGMKNTASNNDFTVEVSGLSMQLVFGYDILHLRRLHFYPQIAFGLLAFDIEVMRKNSVNDITTVYDLVTNPSGTRLGNTSFDMSYGVELDYHLLHTIARGGIIIGVQYGWVVPLAEKKFKIKDSKSSFQTSDSMKESFFSVVAKFYMKR